MENPRELRPTKPIPYLKDENWWGKRYYEAAGGARIVLERKPRIDEITAALFILSDGQRITKERIKNILSKENRKKTPSLCKEKLKYKEIYTGWTNFRKKYSPKQYISFKMCLKVPKITIVRESVQIFRLLEERKDVECIRKYYINRFRHCFFFNEAFKDISGIDNLDKLAYECGYYRTREVAEAYLFNMFKKYKDIHLFLTRRKAEARSYLFAVVFPAEEKFKKSGFRELVYKKLKEFENKHYYVKFEFLRT